MKKSELNISLTPYDDIFKTDEERNAEEIKPIPISELKAFQEQPFKVLLDESMDELVESIKHSGVLSPIIARPDKDGGYEILSGHRRVKACEIALNAAVEISYLGSKEQSNLLKVIEKEESSPTIAQARKIRRFAEEERLNIDVIDSIMQEEKPEKIKITFKEDKLRKYFPKNYTAKQMEDTLLRLIENWYKKRQQEHER